MPDFFALVFRPSSLTPLVALEQPPLPDLLYDSLFEVPGINDFRWWLPAVLQTHFRSVRV
jgi:hypothetical protein